MNSKMFDPRLLESFMAVADRGNFTEAARRLGSRREVCGNSGVA